MAWLDDLVPASFRGVSFEVEKAVQRGGRRLANHQYPKRNKPNSEDMGAKQRQYPLTGFVDATDDFTARDAFIAALDGDGSGLLIHPTYGQLQVMVDSWDETEDLIKERNICRFQISFLESGDDVAVTPTTDTAQVSTTAASASTTANAGAFSSSVASTWA